ncbi:Multidrug efflux pump subunit AcrA precursor [compost metagenome]
MGQDDKIEKRPLEIDRAIGNQWLVGSGLKAGERVVVDGFQRVKVGDKVNPTVIDLQAKADKPRSPGRAPGEAAAPATPAASAPAAGK